MRRSILETCVICLGVITISTTLAVINHKHTVDDLCFRVFMLERAEKKKADRAELSNIQVAFAQADRDWGGPRVLETRITALWEVEAARESNWEFPSPSVSYDSDSKHYIVRECYSRRPLYDGTNLQDAVAISLARMGGGDSGVTRPLGLHQEPRYPIISPRFYDEWVDSPKLSLRLSH